MSLYFDLRIAAHEKKIWLSSAISIVDGVVDCSNGNKLCWIGYIQIIRVVYSTRSV